MCEIWHPCWGLSTFCANSQVSRKNEILRYCAGERKGLKVSYAACFGHSNQLGLHQRQVGDWLAAFDLLSVRNTMSQAMVKKLCRRESQIVADPTLLCDVNILASNPELPYKQYALLYALSRDRFEKLSCQFAQFRKELELPIVAIKSDVLQPWPINGIDYEIPNPGIEQWLGLFRDAAFILTDSFHGTLYAVKNQVPFLNYIGSSRSRERVAYVVDRYALHAGYPPNLRDSLNPVFDFEPINREIQSHVAESMDFLGNIL